MLLLLVTLTSILLALIMSVVAWRVAHEERRRSDARVAALAADIHGDFDLRPASGTAVPAPDLFAPRANASQSGHRGAVAAIGILLLAAAVSLGFAWSHSSGNVAHVENPANRRNAANVANPANPANPATTEEPASSANRAPLELVALGHERDGDRLIVRGVVRNPASGAEVDKLTAVVFVFGGDGAFLASGRAAIQSSALGPGGESTFAVSVPSASDVARYRVSFRTDDQVVPHVDRREHAQEKSQGAS